MSQPQPDSPQPSTSTADVNFASRNSSNNGRRNVRRRLDGSPQPSTSTQSVLDGSAADDSAPTTTAPAATMGPARGGNLFVQTENGENPVDFYLDIRRTRSFKQKNLVQERTYRIEPSRPATRQQHRGQGLMRNVLPQVENMFEALIEDINTRQNPEDQARLYIGHPTLSRPIVLRPRPLRYLTPKVIMSQIAHVLTSEENIPFDEDLDINIATARHVGGSGFAKKAYLLDIEKDRLTKKSVLSVPTEENDLFCLPKAIVIANAHALFKHNQDEATRKTLKSRSETLRRVHGKNRLHQEVEIMMKACNISRDRMGYLEDIPHYENYLKKSICVISAAEGNDIIYPGNERFRKPEERLYLYHWKPFLSNCYHFDVIAKVAAFMDKADICYDCNKILSRHEKENHSCSSWCTVCQSKDCMLQEGAELLCPDCNLTCRSEACFQRHKTTSEKRVVSLCESKYKCLLCHTTKKDAVRERRFHICTESYCSNCKVWTANSSESHPHQCFMRALNKEKLTSPERFIFYDFESTQEDDVHIPNMVVAQSACSRCKDVTDAENSSCNYCGNRCKKCHEWNYKEKCFEKPPCMNGVCGRREVIFRENDVTHAFGSWVLEPQHKGCTFVAHNAKAYDNYFLLNYFLKKNITPSIIFSGSKAVYMHIGKGLNVRFLDSCMFLPMALAELPKCFDLTELKKGYFPHFFNKPVHYGRVFSALPEAEDYGINSMSEEKQQKFLHWYEIHKHETFDFEKEMLTYCRSDVDILRRACLVYRQLLMEATCKDPANPEESGIDPFSFVSAASVCMGVFQARFLPETYKVNSKFALDENCSHDSDLCGCSWMKGEKSDADSPLLLSDAAEREKYSPEEVSKMEKKFVSSPIGLLPFSEYRPKTNYSLEAIEWLKECEAEINGLLQALGQPSITLQTALTRNGEKSVQVPAYGDLPPTKLKLDGYYFDTLLQVPVALEFYGCHWHGCVKCFKDKEKRQKTLCHGKSLKQRYAETMLREERLKSAGYAVRSIWACQFAQSLLRETNKTSDNMRRVKDIHISLRDCYFGGRTAATKMYHNFEKTLSKGIVGKYVDFTSLYPWALKYGKFPIAHPERYTLEQIQQRFPDGVSYRKECTLSMSNPKDLFERSVKHCLPEVDHSHVMLHFFGIAKVFVVPPKNLLHPVLPYRCKEGKLVFPLCAKCSEENNQASCHCPDTQRGWVGTFCSGEIEVALEMGYEITKYFEILHWPESSTTLFESYVNCFLKIKQEASGLPSDVQTQEEVQRYIDLYKRKENIVLDKEKIKKSTALRSLAKLMLNSLYGKFGQRPLMRKTHFVNNIQKLCKILTDEKETMVDFHVLSEDVMHVETEGNQHFAKPSCKTNVIISAFTTSWARLKLWSLMHTLGSRLLYTDTDSMIYISTPEIPDLPLGNYLGDLADELACKKVGCSSTSPDCTHYIVEFVSGGPKNYAYVLNTGEIVCKIRGFTLDCQTARQLNFSVLKNQVFDWLRAQREEKSFCVDPSSKSLNVEGNELNSQKDVVVTRNQIKRCKTSFQLFNASVSKRYSVVFDKNRVSLHDLSSVPFGFTE